MEIINTFKQSIAKFSTAQPSSSVAKHKLQKTCNTLFKFILIDIFRYVFPNSLITLYNNTITLSALHV
jgi:hypothetical protein